MNLIDELTIETGDYNFRIQSNPLRLWKFNMFQVNVAFKEYYRNRRPFSGRCYKNVYISKIHLLFFTNLNTENPQKRWSTTASREYIRDTIFYLNDGDDFAKIVLKALYDGKATHYIRQTDEVQTQIKKDFLQLVNAILYSPKIFQAPFCIGDLVEEFKKWYLFDKKFWRFEGGNRGIKQEIPINPATQKEFEPFELNTLVSVNNLWRKMETTIFEKGHHPKSTFYTIKVRLPVKSLNYGAQYKNEYDITNSKPFNAKGGASLKGMTASHLWEYYSNCAGRTIGWKFGGITADMMRHFCDMNGYSGDKMTYKESINWIMKKMDTQEFLNTPKSKKGKK